MTLRAHLIRPDDLLSLEIEGINLRLELGDPAEPVLVAEDAEQPAYLVVHFPPQTITEEAFYQTSKIAPPPEEASKPFNAAPPTAKLDAPAGLARARIGGPSRLVFRIPAGMRIPYTTEGLLDWRKLELNVSALADLPEVPTLQQMIDAPPIAAPSALDTALELPYRLVLSPRHAVAWEHALGLRTQRGRTELWHTRLALRGADGDAIPTSRLHPAPLRAIWSPDYNWKRFQKTDPPRMGEPDQDWDDPVRNPPGVLTAMTPSDRHELVILTSAFHGFIKGLDDHLKTDYRRFEPTPVYAEQLILSPLGGWLKSRGNWRPPMHWRPRFRAPVADSRGQLDELVRIVEPPRRQPLSDVRPLTAAASHAAVPIAPRLERASEARSEVLIPHDDVLRAFDLSLLGDHGASLNISEWVHVATQGRDHYVRIVYEGVVYPFRHRASLVKVTERKISDGKNGAPVAFLAQRMFIVIRQPELDYDAERTADLPYGRHMPLRRIRFTTLITPDIDPPAKIADDYSFKIESGGRPIRFNAVGLDIGGHHVDFDTALIFMPLGDLDSVTVAQVRKAYLAWGARPSPVPGQQLTFAERNDAPAAGQHTDNTTLTTRALHFSTDDQTAAPDAYLFRPLLFKADVKLPAIEQLLGTDAPAAIAYEQQYLAHGFDAGNTTGLFAHIAKESATNVLSVDKVQAKFAADQAGGIATPDLSISALTRRLGPLAGDDLGKLRSNDFHPAEFFKDVKNTAKLFGSISLLDLLVGGTLDVGAPKVQLSSQPVPGSPNRRKLASRLHWEPQVREAKAGIVVLVPGAATRFVIDGTVERIVEVPPAGSPGASSSRFQGELSDFSIELLNVVQLFFESFRFSSESGRKPEISVALRSPEPLRFKGELDFVNELKKVIPPGLFGDGASLDVSPAGVKAGFGIGLPPLAIGVFALEGVTLNASLELPFVDGKPCFDFGLSSREHPFNLTVAFLGGGGFFHLQVDTDGVRMLEAALEFGASASVNLGVASGGVHIMAGIYFAMGKKAGADFTILAGYLRMGGELSVLGLISVSLEFVLSFGYESGKAAGRATLTVKVEVAFFSKSVAISVEKRFGGSSGDPRFFQVFETPAVWSDYASAFA